MGGGGCWSPGAGASVGRGLPQGMGKGRLSKDWAMLRADLRQILADWWLLKGKLVAAGITGGV